MKTCFHVFIFSLFLFCSSLWILSFPLVPGQSRWTSTTGTETGGRFSRLYCLFVTLHMLYVCPASCIHLLFIFPPPPCWEMNSLVLLKDLPLNTNITQRRWRAQLQVMVSRHAEMIRGRPAKDDIYQSDNAGGGFRWKITRWPFEEIHPLTGKILYM